MKGDRKVINNFVKTWIWLMDYYIGLYLDLDVRIMKNFLEKVLYTDELNVVFQRILNDKEKGKISEKIEKRGILLNVIILLDDTYEMICKEEGFILLNKSLDYLINNFLSINWLLAYLLRKDFENGKKSEGNTYQQSDIIIEFLKVIRKENNIRKMIKKDDAEKEENIKIWENVSKYDLKFIKAHVEYLKFLVILLCITESPFYSKQSRMIASQLKNCLKKILVNCRIEKFFMEPNIQYSEEEFGIHTTTKFEMYFIQSNGDRYCLRLDFPHNDVKKIHFNIHEPFRGTAFPIKKYEFQELCDKCPDCDLNDFFYKYGDCYWFKNNFLLKIKEKCKDEEYVILYKKFCDNRHYNFLSIGITCEDMRNFLKELFEAISVWDMQNCIYKKNKSIDVNEQFKLINILEGARQMIYDINMLQMDEIFNGKNHIYEKKK